MQPINIAAAGLIAQLCLLVIMAGGTGLIAFHESMTNARAKISLTGFILVLALVSMSLLLLSDALSPVWAPAFGSGYEGISWTTALMVVLILDVLMVWFLVLQTGGARVSAFAPIYFTIPALSIFLRETGTHVIVYLVLVIAALIANIGFRSISANRIQSAEHREPDTHQVAFYAVSIACLLLTTYIGYVTRPLVTIAS